MVVITVHEKHDLSFHICSSSARLSTHDISAHSVPTTNPFLKVIQTFFSPSHLPNPHTWVLKEVMYREYEKERATNQQETRRLLESKKTRERESVCHGAQVLETEDV